MQNYFSPATNGFYRTDIHTVMPADAIPITQAEYDAAFAQPGTIGPGPDGKPVLTPAPAIDPKRQQAQLRLAALDAFIPRGLEDAWTASGFDIKTLPRVQQDRLAEKVTLRKSLA